VVMFENNPRTLATIARYCTRYVVDQMRQGTPTYDSGLGCTFVPIVPGDTDLGVTVEVMNRCIAQSTGLRIVDYITQQGGGYNFAGAGSGFSESASYADSGRAALLAATHKRLGHESTLWALVASDNLRRPLAVHEKDLQRPGIEGTLTYSSMAAIGLESLVARNGNVDVALLDSFLYGSTSQEGVLETAQRVDAIAPGLWRRMNKGALSGRHRGAAFMELTEYILTNCRYYHDRQASLRASRQVEEALREKL
jgi:hypothetical protein